LEPKDISGPQVTSEFADFTHMQSPSGFRERKPTYKSSGQVTFRVNYVHTDAGHKLLITLANANPATLAYFRLTYPDNSQFEFNAYTSLQWNSPMAGPIEMTVTLDLTGLPVWQGAGSPSTSVSSSPSAS
jgi:hypothetical protein